MTIIKSYTDLPQSKILAEFLPLKSADYHYITQGEKSYFYPYSLSSDAIEHYDEKIKYIPSWSVAALLGVLPSATLDTSDDHYCRLRCQQRCTEWYDNPVDTCVTMIEKLHELNLL